MRIDRMGIDRWPVKEQIKSGLQLGGSLAAFLLAIIPLVDGLHRVVWASPAHQLLWGRPVGWLELILAGAILVCTAGIWVQWFAGVMLIASVKGIFMILMGGPNRPPQFAVMEAFFLATLVLMLLISLRGANFLDRIALTLFVFCIAWPTDKGLFEESRSVAFGLAGLAVSSGLYYWKRGHGLKNRQRRGKWFTRVSQRER